jgi:hypothetical protein
VFIEHLLLEMERTQSLSSEVIIKGIRRIQVDCPKCENSKSEMLQNTKHFNHGYEATDRNYHTVFSCIQLFKIFYKIAFRVARHGIYETKWKLCLDLGTIPTYLECMSIHQKKKKSESKTPWSQAIQIRNSNVYLHCGYIEVGFCS